MRLKEGSPTHEPHWEETELHLQVAVYCFPEKLMEGFLVLKLSLG